MRVLVVVAGMTLGLSGCIGGGIVHRAAPAGNETADGGDDVDVDQAPWQLKDADGGDEAGGDDKGSGSGSGGDGRKKDDSGGGGSDPGGGGEDPGGQNNDTDDGGELDPVTGMTPTQGAAAAGDIIDNAKGEVPTTGEASVPKQPTKEAEGAVDDVDPERTAGNVDAEKAGNSAVPGSGNYIPSTDPLLLA